MRKESSLSRRRQPPDTPLMSKVDERVSPLAAIKEAPGSSQCVPGLFITSTGPEQPPVVTGYRAALTFGSRGEGGVSGSLGRELAPERGH